MRVARPDVLSVPVMAVEARVDVLETDKVPVMAVFPSLTAASVVVPVTCRVVPTVAALVITAELSVAVELELKVPVMAVFDKAEAPVTLNDARVDWPPTVSVFLTETIPA